MLANLKLKPHRSLQSGFTLLEVLITLIVLAIGLLGLAGLQVVSLRNSHGAYLRSQAITQSYDIVDRMRANSDQTAAYLLKNPNAAITACDTAGGCTAADMAQHDIYKWNQFNSSVLPQGIGVVCRDSTIDDGTGDNPTNAATSGCDNVAGAPLVVKVFWVDDRAATPEPSRFSTVIGDQL